MRQGRASRFGILAVCLTVAATAAVFPLDAQAAPLVFTATLDGTQVLIPNSSLATGTAMFVLNEAQDALTISMTHTVVSPTGAHIHRGAVGANGPVAFSFPPHSPISTTWLLTWADVAQLQAGMLYIDVHSPAFPIGEIRGQITPAPVPEPSTWLLMGTGLVGLAGYGWRKRKQTA